MPPKECDPRCTGRCNTNRRIVSKIADKACDPKCTGRCSKKDVAISSIDEPLKSAIKNLPTDEIQQESLRVDESKKTEIFDQNIEGKEDVNIINRLGGKQISCVIFDLDGVILDIETVYENVITQLVKKFNVPQSEVKKIVDLQNNITARKFCSTYNLSITPEEFVREFRKTSIRCLADCPLMPGVEKVISYLISKKCSLAIATSSNQKAFNLKTAKYSGLMKKFDHIVLGGSDPAIKTRKPSPEIYQVCCSRFSSKPHPSDVLVLEDAPEGVIAARSAGMNVVWLPNKYMAREDGKGAVAIFDSLEEFNPQEFGIS